MGRRPFKNKAPKVNYGFGNEDLQDIFQCQPTPEVKESGDIPVVNPTKSGFDNGLRPLTVRQAAYIRARLSGMTPGRAAMAAGYQPSTASVVEGNPNVQGHMQRLFARHGISMDQLVTRVAEALDAERVELDKAGNVRELGPDWRARIAALEMTGKLTGALNDGGRVRLEGTGAGGAIVIRHSRGLDD